MIDVVIAEIAIRKGQSYRYAGRIICELDYLYYYLLCHYDIIVSSIEFLD